MLIRYRSLFHYQNLLDLELSTSIRASRQRQSRSLPGSINSQRGAFHLLTPPDLRNILWLYSPLQNCKLYPESSIKQWQIRIIRCFQSTLRRHPSTLASRTPRNPGRAILGCSCGGQQSSGAVTGKLSSNLPQADGS